MEKQSKLSLIIYSGPQVWCGGWRLQWFSFPIHVSSPYLYFSLVSYSGVAQYFKAADRIVVLGQHGIIDQGNWQNIKIKAASTAEFSSSHHTKDNAVLSANFDKLSAQFRAKDEAETDLTRQSGDSALYGIFIFQVHECSWYERRLLFWFCWFCTSTVSYAFFITIPQYWLHLWTESGGRDTAFYICGFLFLSTMSWISTSAQIWWVPRRFPVVYCH